MGGDLLVCLVVHSGMCCLTRLFSGGGGWGELLIDGGDGCHDDFKGCLLVDKHCLLVFEFGSEGGKLIKSEFD